MIIVCDAGHGGKDAGGSSLGLAEKHLALRWALRLGCLLQERGHRVVYTRTTDVFVDLATRARIANAAGANLFVSVHANASPSPAMLGAWTIHAKGSVKGEALARVLQPVLAREVSGSSQHVFPDESPQVGGRRLAVLRQTRMPAVLLELGFMTNPEEVRRLEDPCVDGIACAMLANALHRWTP